MQASDDGRTAILAATGRVGAAPIVRLLLDHGASPSDGSSETNPLFASARIGDAAQSRGRRMILLGCPRSKSRIIGPSGATSSLTFLRAAIF
jgi:hypothetical protein